MSCQKNLIIALALFAMLAVASAQYYSYGSYYPSYGYSSSYGYPSYYSGYGYGLHHGYSNGVYASPYYGRSYYVAK